MPDCLERLLRDYDTRAGRVPAEAPALRGYPGRHHAEPAGLIGEFEYDRALAVLRAARGQPGTATETGK